MTEEVFSYTPIPGETYSLFGRSPSTEEYYVLIKELADEILRKYPDRDVLLERIRRASSRKRLLRRAREGIGDLDLAFILGRISPALSEYTVFVEKHLDELPILKFWDRRLRTTEEQYHLYMLEIELVNRINHDSFKECQKKIALLPYCLQDWSGSCKSSMGDLDYVCRRCSNKCYINRVSSLLREHGIAAYIWMSGDLKKLKRLPKSGGRIGGLGVACVPELVMGMRSCEPLGIPVIGLPLDANRCIRWTGSFHENSVNLKRLEGLVQ
jgi:hypothetical protein